MDQNFIPSFPKISGKSKSANRVVLKPEKLKANQKIENQVLRTLEKLLTPQKAIIKTSTIQSKMRLRKFLNNTGFQYESPYK